MGCMKIIVEVGMLETWCFINGSIFGEWLAALVEQSNRCECDFVYSSSCAVLEKSTKHLLPIFSKICVDTVTCLYFSVHPGMCRLWIQLVSVCNVFLVIIFFANFLWSQPTGPDFPFLCGYPYIWGYPYK